MSEPGKQGRTSRDNLKNALFQQIAKDILWYNSIIAKLILDKILYVVNNLYNQIFIIFK